jgi:hypothetical protein
MTTDGRLPTDRVGQAFQQALDDWRNGPTGVIARAQQVLHALTNLLRKQEPPSQQ